MKKQILVTILLLFFIGLLIAQINLFLDKTIWLLIFTAPIALRCVYILIRLEFKSRKWCFKAAGGILIAVGSFCLFKTEMGFFNLGIIMLGEWLLMNHILFKVIEYFLDDSWWKKVIG